MLKISKGRRAHLLSLCERNGLVWALNPNNWPADVEPHDAVVEAAYSRALTIATPWLMSLAKAAEAKRATT